MLQLNDLSVGYEKNKPLIEHINGLFDKSIIGILAKSGVGKTTLFKTLCGVISPLSGSFTASDPIVMMCQKNTNFGWLNCIDNILICDKIKRRKDRPDDAREILHAVGLSEYEDVFPSQLSGGQQQRLSLARVLYFEPRILLMDEPLSALDDHTRADMQALILKQHKELQNTILLVTHSEAEAKLMCDKILYFK